MQGTGICDQQSLHIIKYEIEARKNIKIVMSCIKLTKQVILASGCIRIMSSIPCQLYKYNPNQSVSRPRNLAAVYILPIWVAYHMRVA